MKKITPTYSQLHIFNDENASTDEINSFRIRRATRSVIIDKDQQVALLYLKKYKGYSLPGGGVDKHESFEEACIRESLEETGCNVGIVNVLGAISEVIVDHKLVNYSVGFFSKVLDKSSDFAFTGDEIETSTQLKWVTLNDAIELISNYPKHVDLYAQYFFNRDRMFLEVAKRRFS